MRFLAQIWCEIWWWAARSTPKDNVPKEESTEREAELRQVLRRFPYWVRGHVLLGEASLEAGKVDAAYASAQAILQLRPGDSRGLFLLARSHLRASQHDSALALFQKLQQHRSKALPRSLLAEETAACYMARGDNARAQEILAGETNLSAAGRMALEFCRGRTSRT